MEEVAESDEQDLASWAAKKKLQGWSIPRILISVCVANPDSMRKAFKEAYLSISPDKTDKDANRYYYVFMKQFGNKIKKS